MLQRLFSKRGKYRLYAASLAAGLLVYLFGGFILAKALFGQEPFVPTIAQTIGVFVFTGIFALLHVRSMKDLDTPKE